MESAKQITRTYLTRPRVWFMLAVLAFTAYAPVLKIGFLWDDHVLIEENPRIREWSLSNIKHDFSSTVSDGKGDEGFLRPIVTWSNRLDYSLWGLRPMGFHATSLLLHMGNTILLYELLMAVGFTPIAVFLCAALFGVHPIGVEGLICVTGRATFLSFFFSMATLLLLARPSPTKTVGAMLFFVFALFSKENSVVVPFLALILGWKRGTLRRDALYTIPFFGTLAVYLIFRKVLFGHVGMPHDPLVAAQFYAKAFPRVLIHYIELLLIPWNLHSHRGILRLSPIWFAALAAWIATAVWAYRNRKRQAWVLFCLLWLVTALLPSSIQMIYGGFMLDHWAYWAAPAVLLPIGLLAEHLWTSRSKKTWHWTAGFVFPLIILYALLVRLNLELRNTDEKMYHWALLFTTSAPIRYNYGVVLLQSGRAREAIPYFSAVRETYPENLDNRHALALAYWHSGARQLGVRQMEEILKINPAFEPAQVSLRTMRRPGAPQK